MLAGVAVMVRTGTQCGEPEQGRTPGLIRVDGKRPEGPSHRTGPLRLLSGSCDATTVGREDTQVALDPGCGAEIAGTVYRVSCSASGREWKGLQRGSKARLNWTVSQGQPAPEVGRQRRRARRAGDPDRPGLQTRRRQGHGGPLADPGRCWLSRWCQVEVGILHVPRAVASVSKKCGLKPWQT